MSDRELEQSRLKVMKQRREKEAGPKKKKAISGLTGAAMLVGSMLPLMHTQTAFAATTGTLSVDKNFAAAGETVLIRVTDAGQGANYNTDPNVKNTVQVTAVSSNETGVRNPLPITLIETGENTGVFEANLRLVDPAESSLLLNDIKVANGGIVTILDPSFADPNQMSPVLVNVERRDHTTGVFQTFDNVSQAMISHVVRNSQEIRVELSDDDLNTDKTTIQSRTVNVTTIAGSPGYTLTLTETGVNSGVFAGVFTVGNEISSGNNQPIYLEYADAQRADNTPATITKMLVNKAFTSSTMSISPANAAYDEDVTVTVTDNDLNVDSGVRETTTVKVTSAISPAGITVTLTEIGPDTGVFRGTFKMQNATNSGAGHIGVVNGGVATVAYQDVRDGAGFVTTLTQTTTRKDHISGTISLNKTTAVLGEQIQVTVNDADYINTAIDSISVQVTNPINLNMINVTLNETLDSGVFTGVFTIADTISVPGSAIAAANLTDLTVTYTDIVNHTNQFNQPVTATVKRKDYMSGSISYDRLNVGGQEVIEVTLTDSDLNIDPDVAEQARVWVSSDDDLNGYELTLLESDLNTGVFKGQFKPVTSASNPAAVPPALLVSFNNPIYVDYIDAKNANGVPEVFNTWFAHLQIPAITSITAANGGALNGAGAGDTLTIVFDTLTNGPTNVTLANVSDVLKVPAGKSLGITPGVQWANNYTLIVTLGAGAVLHKNDSITIEKAAGLKSVSGSAISTAAHAIDQGTFGNADLAMLSAAPNYDNTTYRTDGKYFDITFNAPTNKTAGMTATFSKLSVDNSHSLGVVGGSAVWQSSTVLRVTLGAGATVVVGDTITYDPSGESLSDFSLEKTAILPITKAIGGSFGSLKPTLVSVTATNDGLGVGPNAGDLVKIHFDIPTNQSITTSDLNAIVLSSGTWGGSQVSWSDNQTMEIELSSDATVFANSNYTVTIDYDQLGLNGHALMNIGSEGAATLSSTATAIAPSFGAGQLPTGISAATTVAYGNTTYRQGTQSFEITFNQPINKKSGTAALANIIVNEGAHTIGTALNGASAVWQNNGKLLVTLGSDATIQQGDMIKFDPTGQGIMDPSLETAFSAIYSTQITSSFGSQVPVINTTAGIGTTGIYAANVAGGAGAEATDTIKVYFDIPTNKAINDANLASVVSLNKALGGTGSFGSSATVVWNTASEMTIHLGGTGIDVRKGDSVVITAGALKNTGNEGSIPVISAVIDGTFGIGLVPVIDTITATNDTGNGGANQGDKVTVYFTAATSKPDPTSVLNNITLSSTHTFGTMATAAWSLDGKSFIITLGTNATVAVGDTVTISNVAGIKDLSGESAAIIGGGSIAGTFGEIVKPVLSSVYATNGDGTANVGKDDTLEFVFNIPVNHAAFDLSKIEIKNSTGTETRIKPFGDSPTIYWLDPVNGYDTRLQIVFDSNPTIQKTDTVSIAALNGIKDITGTIEIPAVVNQAIRGSFGVAVAPTMTNVYATNGDGKPTVGAGDQLVVVFDTPTNGGTVNLSNFTVSNSHTIGTTGLTSSWSSDKLRLTITLGAGTNITTQDTLTINSGSGIWDATNQVALPGTPAKQIGGSFGVAVAPVVSNITAKNSNGLPGAGAGDTLVLTLDSPSNGAAIDLTKLSFTSGHTLGGAGLAQSWSSDKLQLIVTLGAGATIAKSDLVSISTGSLIFDSTGGQEMAATTVGIPIGGSFGEAVAPVIKAIHAVNGDGKPTVGAGDKLLIIFDTPTKGGNVALSEITVGNNVSHNFGAGASYTWSANNTHLNIVLGSIPSLAVGDTINVSGLSGITDASGQAALAAISNIAIQDNFGTAVAPMMTNVYATNGDGQPTVGAGDQLVVVFDTPTNGGTVNLSNFVVSNSHTLGTIVVPPSWSNDNLRLTITLGVGTNITTQDTLTINSGSGIWDATNQVALPGTPAKQIGGSFGVAVAPVVSNITAKNSNGQPGVGAGDTLVLTLDSPSNGAAVDLTKLSFTSGHSLGGAGLAQSWSNDKLKLIITLGAGATIAKSDLVSISTGSLIFDSTGGQETAATTVGIPIGGSFGEAVAPVIKAIHAVNGDGKPTVGAGDKLLIIFDTPTKGGNVALSEITVGNNVSHNFGAGASYTWSANNTHLNIVLGSNPSLAVGDTINVSALSGITDASGQAALAAISNIAILDNFGTAVAPVIASIIAVNVDGKPGAAAGDKLLINFDTPTNGGTVDFNKIIVSNSRHLGTSPTYSWNLERTQLTIVFGSNPTIAAGDTISVLATSGIADASGQAALAAISDIAINGNFGIAIAPVITSITAIDSDGTALVAAGDKLRIVFDSAVQLSGFTLNDVLVNSSTGNFGTGASFALDPSGTILTITLGSASVGINNSSVITVTGGIFDAATGTKLLANGGSLPTLGGSFGTAIVPNVVSAIAVDGNGLNTFNGDKIVITFDAKTNGAIPNTTLTKDLITVTGSTYGSIGDYALFNWTNNNRVLTVTLSTYGGSVTGSTYGTVTNSVYANLQIGDILNLTNLGIMDPTGTVPVNASNVVLGGSFVPAIIPRYTYALATSNNRNSATNTLGTIQLLFDTEMDTIPVDLNQIVVSNNHVLGANATVAWSSGTVLSITIRTDATVQAGDTIDLSNLHLMDRNKIAYLTGAAAVQTLSGSFGTIIDPVLSRIDIKDEGTASAVGDQLVFSFNADVSVDADFVTNGLSKIVVSNGHTLGALNASHIQWDSSGTKLTITIAAGATIQANDTISILAGSGIKDITGFKELAPVIGMQLNGTFGTTAAPAVISVTASNDGGNPGAGQGDLITIRFASNTNGIAGATLDVSSLAALVGTDATAAWVDSRTLVITVGNLGPNPALKDNGSISLDTLNIMDPTAASRVTGTYVIGGSFGQANIPRVSSIVASSADTSKTNSAISNGDSITITFDMPTNQSGELLDAAAVNQFVTFGTSSNPKVLGAGYKGRWSDNGKVLTITVTDVTGSTIQIGDNITVSGIKNAMGTSNESQDTVALGGIFDGRQFAMTANGISSSGAGNLTAVITIQPVKDHAGKEVIIFELIKGNVPVQIIASQQDIVGNTRITQAFDNIAGPLTDYTVKAYLFDNINSSSGSELLSQVVTMKLQ